jgi:hypothetical protein
MPDKAPLQILIEDGYVTFDMVNKKISVAK